MSSIRCKSCGALIPIVEGEYLTCPYCGSVQKSEKGGTGKSSLPPKQPLCGLKIKTLVLFAIAIFAITVAIGAFISLRDQPPVEEKCMPDYDTEIFQDVTHSEKIGIDLYHGTSWKGIDTISNETGFDLNHIDGQIQAKGLARFRVLLIFGSTGKSFSRREVCTISDFVRYGGSIIVAAQAWSWSYKEYGNKPNRDFPLNVLGRELGYRITENNIFGPDYLDEELKKNIKTVTKRNWDPSQIELPEDEMRVFIRDTRGRIIAGSFVHGKGKVIVCGHDTMLEENPGMLKFFLTNVVK
jgi:hypothetical protein